MGHSLSVKLLALLTIALLPLGLIAVYQTFSVVSEADNLSRREMLARTMEAARTEVRLISEAHGAAYALGTAAVQTGTDTELCASIMRGFVADDTRFAFAGFIEANGMMRCFSSGDVTDFSEYETWKKFISSPRPSIVINRRGTATGQSVLIASAPVFDGTGALLGAGSVSIPHSLLDVLLKNEIAALDVALADGEGNILAASSGVEETVEFELFSKHFDPNEVPLHGALIDVEGTAEATSFAVVPLSIYDIFVVGKWSTDMQQRAVSLLGTATPLFPVVMWIASLFVAAYAIQHFVLRHLKILRARMRQFSIDEFENSYVYLNNAPSELSEIGNSYNNLLDRIHDGRQELEANVREKELLLKEVHHRVKNNLQLIASILNMQLRQIETPEAQSVLRRVQKRVMSLATIHKLLYSDNKVDMVRADVLLTEILQSTMKVGTSGKNRLKTRFDMQAMELDPDRAVPLALLTTEAVTNALKYVGASEGANGFVSVTLAETDDGMVTLEIVNSIDDSSDATDTEDGTGLGSRLIQAFVSQLDGDADITRTDETYTLRVDFPKNPHEAADTEAA